MGGSWETVKAQVTGGKLVFNVLFHGFHIGLFALGWYVAGSTLGCCVVYILMAV